MMQIPRSRPLQQVDFDRRRVAPRFIQALLGVAILTEATQVSANFRTDPSSPMSQPMLAPWTPPSAPVTLRDVAMRARRMDMSGAAAQMTPSLQNRAITGSSRVLTGTIAYADPTQGFAIIGSSVQNTYLARPGQQLPDGSWIREVHRDHVVLEHEGNRETVGMYERGQPADTLYAQQFPPIPQQVRLDQSDLIALTADEKRPSQAQPADAPPDNPRPSDTRPNETPAHEARSSEAPPSDALPKQAQPEDPLPAAQDPADEFSDNRRQRAENRRK
jgi:Type II secretion system protein C